MSFKKSLDIGKIGEVLYYQAHEGKLERLDGLNSDFRVVATGEGLELKLDTYSMESTQNFFIERYSDKDKQSPGGPWAAQSKGSNLFAYMFVQNLTIFTFNTDELVGKLETIIPSIEPTMVRNQGYITQGYRVPRNLLVDIATVNKLKVGLE